MKCVKVMVTISMKIFGASKTKLVSNHKTLHLAYLLALRIRYLDRIKDCNMEITNQEEIMIGV